MSAGTIRVRGQMTAVFFFGDMPLGEDQLKRLPGYVGAAWLDVYASDIENAAQAAAEAMHPFEVSEDD